MRSPILTDDEQNTLVAISKGEPHVEFWCMNLRAAGLLDDDHELTDAGREYVAALEEDA